MIFCGGKQNPYLYYNVTLCTLYYGHTRPYLESFSPWHWSLPWEVPRFLRGEVPSSLRLTPSLGSTSCWKAPAILHPLPFSVSWWRGAPSTKRTERRRDLERGVEKQDGERWVPEEAAICLSADSASAGDRNPGKAAAEGLNELRRCSSLQGEGGCGVRSGCSDLGAPGVIPSADTTLRLVIGV